MNPRIEQLAEECWTHTSEPLFSVRSPHWEFDRNRFAVLIVQMCANIVRNSSLPDSYSEACLEYIADELEEHFGVEE